MKMGNSYTLPELPYGYKDLQPQLSEEQLKIHHEKHHAAYVKAANALLEKIDNARKDGADYDAKAVLKDLSFQIGGHKLHSLFWGNLAPAGKGGKPEGAIAEVIEKEFGSFDRFKSEFTKAAVGVEGSGWAALTFCKGSGRPLIMQIEKHNVNVFPGFKIILVIDVFEHAYYIDYKNDRAKYVETIWQIINWNEVNNRLKDLQVK
jgi:superoxide dismutase, Fe-Mn family